MLYFEFFRKWFCARCGVSVWWNYSWSTCFSFSLIGDNGQTWTYLNVSGRSSRITFVGKNSLQTAFARTLICGALCCNFFLHHSEIWSRKQMHGDARTTSDSERLTQLLHTRVLEMIIYFLWADATGKPANSNLYSNSVKQCTEFLEGLSAKPAAPVPY